MTDTNHNRITEEIFAELAVAKRAMDEGNPGKARVCCRRAVGVAVRHSTPALHNRPLSAIAALRILLADENLPEPVRASLVRLLSKATPDERDTMSDAPLADAISILRYLGHASTLLDEFSP